MKLGLYLEFPQAMRLLASICCLFCLMLAMAYCTCDVHKGWGPSSIPQYSGYVDIQRPSSDTIHLFYWMFDASNRTDAPLLVWFNGGPGCSSLMGLFEEGLGPFMVNETDGSVYTSPHPWTDLGTVLFIDQPVGTGFSYGDVTDFDTHETQVAEDMLQFFQSLYQCFPWLKEKPLFLLGESFAGRYIPAITHRLLLEDEWLQRLRGIAIGDGWVAPLQQYLSYPHYAAANNLISKDTAQSMLHLYYNACVPLLAQETAAPWLEVEAICGSLLEGVLLEHPGMNPYDITSKCEGTLCYPSEHLTQLLNRAEVRASLGVPSTARAWEECRDDVFVGMSWFTNGNKSSLPDLSFILNTSAAHILIYEGTNDLLCNWMAALDWSQQIPWDGRASFQQAQWKKEFPAHGLKTKAYDRLQLTLVENAGHEVPRNQPVTAHAMLAAFIKSTL